MQKLAEVCVRRPVFATVLILSLVVVGIFSYFRLGVDRFPKVEFSVVTVVVRQPGASPEEIETELVDKIEESVNTISGIDQLYSYSYEGVGQIVVSFQLEKDINVAAQEVRDKVNLVMPDLPLGIEAPVVDKVDPDATPILEVAVSSPANIRDTTEYVDKVLRRQIESISGVGQVRVIGGRARQINLTLDPQRLRAVGLTALDVQRAVQSQNIQIPGGRVDQNTRELTLRTYGRVDSVQAFGDIVLARRPGSVVHLRDVAIIEDSMEEAETVASLNGTPTLLLSIRKQSGLNTVATVRAVKDRLTEVEKRLPPGYKMTITRDQSEYIEAATHAVQEHLIVGSILAALVVLLFLWNWRTTLISAIAIPTSIISTFALMYAMGFTLNGLTLLALTLSVGIVIDDAIVVLENIFRFIEEKRMNPFEAAIEGTREIGMAVLATTLSLIAVFLPVAFMTGIVGRFMNSFGLTMAFAIAVSLLVSFTFALTEPESMKDCTMKKTLIASLLALGALGTAHAADIVDTAVAAGSFKTLVTAVQAAGLVDTLKGPGPFTVFAPTDEAFAKIPKATLDALLKDKAALTKVLTYHVVPGKVMAKDVKPGMVTTVQGSKLTVSTTGGVKVDAANVVKTDIAADNGVIHVIDTVIMPK